MRSRAVEAAVVDCSAVAFSGRGFSRDRCWSEPARSVANILHYWEPPTTSRNDAVIYTETHSIDRTTRPGMERHLGVSVICGIKIGKQLITKLRIINGMAMGTCYFTGASLPID